MDTILEKILKGLNTGIGAAGSFITLYDYFTSRNDTHIKETFTAIREKSKEAYDSYCEYCEYRKNDIGVPVEEYILDYWESCLKRNALPGVADMVSLNIATKAEAEIMLAYLLEAWMEIPDFVEWLHGILTQNKLDELAGTLTTLEKNLASISELTDELKQQDINNVAFTISPSHIIDAKYSCTDLDIKHFYMVDNRFETMLKVISAEHDIPHINANQKLVELAESSHPVIIAGNGGLGKTSLMMRAAVQWVSCGRTAVWLSLSDQNVITEQKASAFFKSLAASMSAGQKVLLCIDNPYEGKASFSNLQKAWPGNDKIQLIMAERTNRLSLLADPAQDSLLYWFDDAKMILLQGLNQTEPTFELKDYEAYPFPETQKRRKEILDKCTLFLVKEGIVEEQDKLSCIQTILNRYGKPAVSLVELIYRTLFELKKRASKPGNIKLDWEEWADFIEKEFGNDKSYTRKELYGVIAALRVFDTPTTISFFCKYFNLEERKLKNLLKERLMSHHSEPVIFHDNTLQPKHDVIAELFFLFHEKTVSINSIMSNMLQCMDENEVESLLKNMVIKKEFQKGKKYQVGQIAYRDYMDEICNRIRKKHDCNLSEAGKAYLCLGYMWARFQQSTSGDYVSIYNILNEIAPRMDDTRIMAKLYTEWGIMARNVGDDTFAEEKYRMVVEKHPKDIVSRTELGKLLSKQKGRERETEVILREVIKLDSRNIQSRTELGRLFSRQKGREKEAEDILREAIRIDPDNLHPHTELGKLLSKQKGREQEAEEVLREAMRIDPEHIHSRTELGKLFSKQKGREKEAEEVLREVIKIKPGDLYARILLAKLYENCNRQTEAVVLYQEICTYNPENLVGRRGLKRLKKYIKE